MTGSPSRSRPEDDDDVETPLVQQTHRPPPEVAILSMYPAHTPANEKKALRWIDAKCIFILAFEDGNTDIRVAIQGNLARDVRRMVGDCSTSNIEATRFVRGNTKNVYQRNVTVNENPTSIETLLIGIN